MLDDGHSIKTAYFSDLERVSPFPNRRFDKDLVRDWIIDYQDTAEEELREKIIYSGLFWVVKLANMFCRKYGMWEHWSDLVQEGNLGLIRTLEKFDVEKGFSYSTYSTYWIKLNMARFVMNQCDIVRRPVHVHEKISTLRRMILAMESKMRHMDISEEQTSKIQQAKEKIEWFNIQSNHISLDQPITEDSDTPRIDFLFAGADESMLILERIYVNELREKTKEYLREHFSPRDADIFMLKTGLATGEVLKLEEVGSKYGLTKERVRQIVNRIIIEPRFKWFFFKLLSLHRHLIDSEVFTNEPVKTFSEEKISSLLGRISSLFGIPVEVLTNSGRIYKSDQYRLAHWAAAWVLREHCKLRFNQVANLLGTSSTAVRSRYKKCKLQIKEDLSFSDLIQQLMELIRE